ncbi:hypothetical protein KVR01_002962 [Diaporthe batatas]|uniref:uncharacterized protein n=1 Tax=Diaporthe batatas TaxID=748121 RepID=UPI001D03CDE8|nr:uncharacterized protein KVR01_002962 [Diaporthe batatas]KAG8167273.1 hypothetical protein KVR01_002962 [Diaporthe batatas]
MYSQFVIAALAATASASTNLFPGHVAIRRDLLIARQTTDSGAAPTGTSGDLSDSECQASLISIATELPTPSDDLLEWEQSQLEAGTDPCSITSVPATLSSQYSSYTDAVLSWYSESSSELIAAISACPQYAGAVSEADVCTKVTMTSGSVEPSATHATGSDSSEPSATGSAATGHSTGTATESTGTASGSASQSTETTAGAPLREAGIIGAVLAGVLGVAVVL